MGSEKCDAEEHTIDNAPCSLEAQNFPYLIKNSLNIGFVIYMGTARVSIYYVSLFKFTFVGRFYKNPI